MIKKPLNFKQKALMRAMPFVANKETAARLEVHPSHLDRSTQDLFGRGLLERQRVHLKGCRPAWEYRVSEAGRESL